MRVALVLVMFAACGDDSSQTGDGGVTGDGSVGDGSVSSCDPPGKYGVPEHTLELPANGTGIYYPDVQAAFPDVDWQTLDRLYLPAGEWKNVSLGNLPVRTAERPLVITNKGGRFFVGKNPTGNYLWSMGGGANWILTGRYDEVSQTGDAAFPGHACGAYADSQYGVVSDDEYALDAPYLHMGISVGGGATDFAIEYVEVARSGFAGIRLYNDHSLDQPMSNVRIHDNYIHDVDGEGVYFGWTGTPPSNLFAGLEVYNNRILRAGNETLQVQDLGPGTRIHHNTFISGGMHWLDNGLGRYQDSNAQVLVRSGSVEFDHNVFIDGAGTLLSFFSAPQAGDGDRTVNFHDNYFSDAASLAIYLNGSASGGSSFTFADNVFRGLDFAYAPVDTNDPDVVASKAAAMTAPITFTNNRWSGTTRIVAGVTGGDGTAGAWTLTGNTNVDPGAIELTAGPWTTSGHHLTWWTRTMTVTGGNVPVTYKTGDVVAHGTAPTLYRATADTTSEPPGTGWTEVPRGSDDVRVVAGSQYAGYGVQ